MVGDVQRETRAWKLFTLLPFRLLRRVPGQSHVSKDELHARFNEFGDGQWAELLDEALQPTTVNVPRSMSVDSAERRAEAAERKVMLGEVSRARQCLTGAALAPGTEEAKPRAPGLDQANFSGGERVPPRSTGQHRSQGVLAVFEVGTSRVFTRTRWMHL